ncbi:helix-turn-helix domain-containing protein [Sphingobacterium spiritivorum]|uniref:helix-turn-helix domain-containing protein n=1 Tax=Sphingobacterium spiritivorum TaxID=258 RepID=UPI003DA5FC1E
MKEAQLYIKGMCCERCIEKVKQLLGEGNYHAVKTMLGEVTLENKPTEKELATLNRKLAAWGFSLVNSHTEQVVARARAAIFQYMNEMTGKSSKYRLSDYVADRVGMSYYYISRIFSAAEKTTMEKFLILLKVERVKELLLQDETTITDIAYGLGYSSPQSLSSQFKKVTGKTPGEYRIDPIPGRVHIDKIGAQNFVQKAGK